MKNAILSIIVSLLLLGCSDSYSQFQADADIVRLNDLVYYGGLIEEYKEKTGLYPFEQDADVAVYALILSPQQYDDVPPGGPSYAHKTTTSRYFFEELEAGLGREIDEYYDPQFAPDTKPNFYIYLFKDGFYNFAVHVSKPYSFANHVSRGYNKVEVTNSAPPDTHLMLYDDMIKNESFQKSRSQKISKPAFFTQRRDQFLRATDCLENCSK